MPLGAEKVALLGAAGGVEGNYFGDGSDGAVTTSGDVTYTVANKSGSDDGDMVVKNYSSLVVSSGDTITTDQPCRGMLIYVKGDCTITGTMHMNGKGGCSDPTASGGGDSSAVNASGIRMPMFTSGGSATLSAADFAGSGNASVAAVANQPEIAGDGTIFVASRDGAAGGNGVSISGWGSAGGGGGSNGTTGGATLSSGGGGGGGGHGGGYSGTANAGNGSKGGCFSGGSGGGGAAEDNCNSSGNNATDYGCAPGSGGACGGSMGASSGDGNGTGGLIWIIAKGDVTITGNLSAKGENGANSGGNYCGTGAGSAGVIIFVLNGGSYTANGTISLAGGIGGNCGSNNNGRGGTGGTGGFHQATVDT